MTTAVRNLLRTSESLPKTSARIVCKDFFGSRDVILSYTQSVQISASVTGIPESPNQGSANGRLPGLPHKDPAERMIANFLEDGL